MKTALSHRRVFALLQYSVLVILLCFFSINKVRGNVTRSAKENPCIEKSKNTIDFYILEEDDWGIFPAFSENKKIDHSEKFSHLWFNHSANRLGFFKNSQNQNSLNSNKASSTSKRFYILFRNLRL